MGEQEEDRGNLVLQRGKKLNDEYYIVSVYDSAEKTAIAFAAYELDTSETFSLTVSYSELDALLRSNTSTESDRDLANPSNKEGRFEWVVDRLDFASDGAGGKKLVVATEPTPEDDFSVEKTSGQKRVPTAQMSYAERQRIKQEMEKLEERRAQNVAAKSEKARKAFLAEQQEKARLEHHKNAARAQRIEEERAERREREALQKRIKDDQRKRYEENDKKRAQRSGVLDAQRKERDLATTKQIVDEDKALKEDKVRRIEEAVARKREAEAAVRQAEEAKKRELAAQEEKRDGKIGERRERYKQAEVAYLTKRQQDIDRMARDKQEAAERKAKSMYERSVDRAKSLKQKQDRAEANERLEDQRTQGELKRCHDRDMLMLQHYEDLKMKKEKADMEARDRKQAAQEERREQEAKEQEKFALEQKVKSELEQNRNRQIGSREAQREQRNQIYIEKVRNAKTGEEMKQKDRQQHMLQMKSQNRDKRIEARKAKIEQEGEMAGKQVRRDENIRKREIARDAKLVADLEDQKQGEAEKQVELEAVKMQKRLQEKERAQKQQEELEHKRQEWERLEKLRNLNIAKKESDWKKREQHRVDGGAGVASAGTKEEGSAAKEGK